MLYQFPSYWYLKTGIVNHIQIIWKDDQHLYPSSSKGSPRTQIRLHKIRNKPLHDSCNPIQKWQKSERFSNLSSHSQTWHNFTWRKLNLDSPRKHHVPNLWLKFPPTPITRVDIIYKEITINHISPHPSQTTHKKSHEDKQNLSLNKTKTPLNRAIM